MLKRQSCPNVNFLLSLDQEHPDFYFNIRKKILHFCVR